MRCDEFETRLNRELDARRNPADDRLLARHAQGCRSCRQLAAALEAIGESLQWSEQPEPDPALAERVLFDLARPTTARAPGRRWSIGTHLALAAALAIMAVIVLPARPPQRLEPPTVAQSPLPAAAELARAPLEAIPPAPHVGQLAREATSRYATLARSTSDSLAEVWSLWQPHETRFMVEEETPGEPLLAEMAAGLRPLADSTTGAMSLLLNVLSVGHSPSDARPVQPIVPAGQAAT